MIEKIDDEQGIIAQLEGSGLSDKRRRALLAKLGQVGTERSIGVLGANLQSSDV